MIRRIVRSVVVTGIASLVVVMSGVGAVHAELTNDQLAALNPKWTKYKDCPTDGPCYLLDTRFISARITDPSEVGECQLGISSRGDENYVLPMMAIIDGMGMNSSVLATEAEQEFRVNVTKRTWEGTGRGSNLGTQWYDRETTAGVTLARQQRSKAASKQLQWKDYVTPINRSTFVNDGVIITMNFMEHDNARTADLDRLYFQKALEFKSGLVSTSNANDVRSTLAASPDYSYDATIQSVKYLTKIAPKVAEVVVAAQTGGATAALTAGASDLGTTVGLFKGLYDSLILYDTDDVGEQKTVFVSFKDLPLGKEVEFKMSGKVDPTACDTGGFEVSVGVKLSKVKDNPKYKPVARPAAPQGFTYLNGTAPSWRSGATAGQLFTYEPGSFVISNASAQAVRDLKVVHVPYYCATKEQTTDVVVNRCTPGSILATQTAAGAGDFTLGGGVSQSSTEPISSRVVGKWGVIGTSLVQGQRLLAIRYSEPLQVGAASSTTVPSGPLTATATAQPGFTAALTPGQKFPMKQGTFNVVNATATNQTVMVVSGVFYCPTATSDLGTCTNGGVINSTSGTLIGRGQTQTIGGAGGSAGTIPAAQSGKYAFLRSNAVNKATQEILATTTSAPVLIGGTAQQTTMQTPAPTAGDCPRLSGSVAVARTCPTMTVVGGGNAKATSKIVVTSGTYDTGVQRATRQVFLYACTSQDHATCTNIGAGTNVEATGSYTFDLAALGGASLVGKYLHAESFVQNPSTFVGLGTFEVTPRYIGVNP